MFGTSHKLLVELRALIEQLGDHGGLISPSVYETAQVLRLHPPSEDARAGLEWLLAQQNPDDGGWGVAAVPSTRDVPTLAAILALYSYPQEISAEAEILAGLSFLERQASQWKQIHIDLLPVACEMILPYLLDEAAHMGIDIDPAPYERLFELRRIKLEYLGTKSVTPNSAPSFSWEAMGLPHVTELLVPRTGVGHSPAATAAWLASAKAVGESPLLCAQAEEYLHRASLTTETGIPGVMPMAYPITGFELCYGLYPLVLTGLIHHPFLRDVVEPKLAKIKAMLENQGGLGFGEGFVADVDDTSVAVAVLQAAQQPTDAKFVRSFWQRDHFYTYVHELNPSVYSNAHALHALVLSGERCELTEQYIIQQQTPGGGWNVDKWHTSWRSATMEVVAALSPLGYEAELARAAQALITSQNEDGSWGAANDAPMLETAHSLIALQLLAANLNFKEMVESAFVRGQQWLWARQDKLACVEPTWLCKEVYSPVRVDQAYKLCAMLSLCHFPNSQMILPTSAAVTQEAILGVCQ